MNKMSCDYTYTKWVRFVVLPVFGSIAILLSGCGSKDSSDKTPPMVPHPAKPKPAAEASPDAAAPAPAPAPPDGAAPAPATPAAEPAADGDPNSTEAVLRALNLAVHQYSDPNTRPDADNPAPKKIYPPIKDLSDLVKTGFIKALPTPPAGKQFKLDAAKLEVVLVDK